MLQNWDAFPERRGGRGRNQRAGSIQGRNEPAGEVSA